MPLRCATSKTKVGKPYVWCSGKKTSKKVSNETLVDRIERVMRDAYKKELNRLREINES